MRNSLIVAALFVMVGCGVEATDPSQTGDPTTSQDAINFDTVPNGKGMQTIAFANGGGGKARPSGNGISYHNGPVMTGTPNIYLIWYGNWSGDSTASTVINAWANGIGGSPYYNINSTYYNGSGTHVSNAAHNAGSTTDNYSQGTAISDSGIQAIVSSAISSGRLPSDSNGVYFVLTSSDVNETSGFCTQYCGWHTHGTIGGVDIKYSFVGGSARCPSACEWQATGPNGGGSGDGMASIIAHEFEETTSDPDLNAWYDSRGAENADKCAWTFGTTSTASNGAVYNQTIGGKQMLIQRNWVNASGGLCATSW